MVGIISALAWLTLFSVFLLSLTSLALKFLGKLYALLTIPLLLSSIVWLLVEALSSQKALEAPALQIFWIFSTLVVVSCAIQFRAFATMQNLTKETFARLETLPVLMKVVLFAVVGVWATAFLIALISPPNNWDSMTYHMPRVMHWIANGTVEPYLTPITRQIGLPPLSSYILLQTILVTADDYLANLLNWLCGAWSLMLITFIAWKLSRNPKITALALIFAATIPIGIAEATTTQNDWMVTLWTLAMVAVMVKVFTGQKNAKSAKVLLLIFVPWIFFCAAATKQHALLYCTIGYIAISLVLLKHRKFRLLLASGLLCVVATAVALIPVVSRNIRALGNPLGPPDLVELGTTRALLDPSTQGPSLLGHALFNVPIPGILPIQEWGNVLFGFWGKTTEDVFDRFGWSQYLPFPGLQLHEDSAASPITFFLGLTFLGLMSLRARDSTLRRYAAVSLIIGFVPMVYWESNIGTNRYLLPFFTLACVAIAYGTYKWPKNLLRTILASTTLYAWFIVLNLEYRPILREQNIFTANRFDMYFAARPTLLASGQRYRATIASRLAKDDERPLLVRALLSGDDYEYPLWKVAAIGEIRVEAIPKATRGPSEEVLNAEDAFSWN